MWGFDDRFLTGPGFHRLFEAVEINGRAVSLDGNQHWTMAH